MIHHSLPSSRHIQLFGLDAIGRDMLRFRDAERLPAESCVVHVEPCGEMYGRRTALRGLSAELRHLLLGDDSVSPPLMRLLDGLWRHWRRRSPARYVIVFGKTDQEWTPAHERLLPGNVVAVFANNIRFRSSRSIPYPMGRDWRLAAETYRSGGVAPRLDTVPKVTACYANFGRDTHGERPRVEALCRLNPTIDCRDLGASHRDYRVSYAAFLERLASSWYCICPRGAGLDTYRFWDCLYLGVVPVVLDDAPYRSMPARVPYRCMPLEDLQTTDFHRLVEERRAGGSDPFEGLRSYLDAEYWRTMIRETLRLGRCPTVNEVLDRLPAETSPDAG